MFVEYYKRKIQQQLAEIQSDTGSVSPQSPESPDDESHVHSKSTTSHQPSSLNRQKSASSSHSRHSSQSSSSNKYRLMNAVLITMMLFCTFGFQFQLLLGFFGIVPKNDKYCGVWPNMASIWWHSIKFFIYLILILRLKTAFDGSAYEYNWKIIYGLTVFVALFWLYAIFGDMTEIYGSVEYIVSENRYWCQVHLAIYGVALSGGIDTILSMLCLILFTKPLLNILRNTRPENPENAKHDNKLQNFVIKYFLLTLIAISSTAIWTILALTTNDCGALVAIDVNINALCILLMGSTYQPYYFILCKPCHVGIGKLKKTAKVTKSMTNVHV